KLLRLQHRSDIEIEIKGVHPKPLRRVCQDLVLSPRVRNAAREGDHLPQRVDLAVARLALGDRSYGEFALELFDELVALFRQDFHRIGRQQLVVAERGGDGPTMLVVFEPGLDVVTAVSGRLEAVNPDDLFWR